MENETTPKAKCQYSGCNAPAVFILSNPHNGDLACCASCAPSWAKAGETKRGVYTVRKVK